MFLFIFSVTSIYHLVRQFVSGKSLYMIFKMVFGYISRATCCTQNENRWYWVKWTIVQLYLRDNAMHCLLMRITLNGSLNNGIHICTPSKWHNKTNELLMQHLMIVISILPHLHSPNKFAKLMSYEYLHAFFTLE